MATQHTTAAKRKNGDHQTIAKEQVGSATELLNIPPADPKFAAPVPAGGGALPAHLAGLVEADAGKGVSTASEDNIIPLVYLLQPLSPQCMRGNADQIEGAQPGDIWLRGSAVQEIVPGDKGIVVQPCAFEKVWIEWMPARGGFVARHAVCPDDARETETTNDKGDPITVMARKNGNHVIETREHYCIAEGQPYVIPFSSTGHTVSRTWMALMNQFRVNGKPAPSFSRNYRLTSKVRQKKSYSWYVFSVEDLGWVQSREEYEVGKMLHEAVASGAKRAADHADTGTTAAEAAAGEDAPY